MKYFISIMVLTLLFIGCNKNNIPKRIVLKPEKKEVFVKKIKPIVIKKTIKTKEIKVTPKIKEIIKNDIAIIYASKKIGKYAIEATNSAMVYLINKKDDFSLNIYDIENENEETIKRVLDQLKEKNITKVLFMLTSSNIDLLFNYKDLDFFNIYLPLVNNKQTFYNNKHIVFGGVNYKDQFEVLLSGKNTHIVEIYDDSSLGKTLHNEVKKLDKNILSFKLSGKHPNFTAFLNRNKKLINSTLLLNTPIIKSSIILSQLRANEIEINQVLSTQINYTPLLLALTQKEDREYLVIANNIGTLPEKLEAINILLGNDILYNWVNYSVVLGMEYLKKNKNLLFGKIEIINNQVSYKMELINAKNYNFSNYESKR